MVYSDMCCLFKGNTHTDILSFAIDICLVEFQRPAVFVGIIGRICQLGLSW